MHVTNLIAHPRTKPATICRRFAILNGSLRTRERSRPRRKMPNVVKVKRVDRYVSVRPHHTLDHLCSG